MSPLTSTYQLQRTTDHGQRTAFQWLDDPMNKKADLKDEVPW
jgi:hypothetical protein